MFLLKICSKLLKQPSRNFLVLRRDIRKNCRIPETAIVAGISQGLGIKFVNGLLSNGIKNIILTDFTINKNTKKELKKLRDKFHCKKISFVQCDFVDENEVYNLYKDACTTYGCIDLIVNNVGVFNEDLWYYMLDINLHGIINGTTLAFKFMSKKNGGRGGTVVNVSSILGLNPEPCAPTFSMAEHAIVGYSKSIGLPFHYENSGVRVMVLCPGSSDKLTNPNSYQTFKPDAQSKKWIEDSDVLTPEDSCNAGYALIKMWMEGQSGSIWVVERHDAYEIEFPRKKSMKKKEQYVDLIRTSCKCK